MAIHPKPSSFGHRAPAVIPERIAYEAILAGQAVQLKPNISPTKWELSDASVASPLRGIALADAQPGDFFDVLVDDVVNGYPANTFTPGALVFLSHSARGSMTHNRPLSTTGKTVFVMGQAEDDTSIRLILETLEDVQINFGAHELSDTLIHNIAENYYYEITRTNGHVQTETWWETPSKLKKIREISYTRTPANTGLITQVITKQYDSDGILVSTIGTLTETVNRSGEHVTSISAVKS